MPVNVMFSDDIVLILLFISVTFIPLRLNVYSTSFFVNSAIAVNDVFLLMYLLF
jgi:hypothetical protein